MPYTLFAVFATLVCCSVASTPVWKQLSDDVNATANPAYPAGRSGAIAVPTTDGSVIISGGCSSSCCFAPLSDVWRLDGATWTQLDPIGAPGLGPRLYHGASPRNATSNFVFGGTDVATGFFNDLWVLSVVGPSVSWRQLSPGGILPGGRAGHSQVALPLATQQPSQAAGTGAQASFLAYGGENGTDVLADLWLYDASSSPAGQWRVLDAGTSSSGPGPRTQHASALITDTNGRQWMVLHGGSDDLGDDNGDAWVWDVAAGGWHALAPSSPSLPTPAARHGHELLSGTGVGLYLFGGQNGTEQDSPYLGDTWRLDIDPATWTVSYTLLQQGAGKSNGTQPVARALGAVAVGLPQTQAASAGGGLYFGGFSGYGGGLDDELHNDVWQLQLA